MKCPSCQNQVEANQKYCPFCGKNLLHIENASWKGLAAVGALLALAFLIWALSYSHHDSAQEVVQNQLTALRNQKLTEAYYAYTSKEFQATTSLEDFKKFLKSYKPLNANSTAELTSKDDQNNLKRVQGLLKSADGETLTLDYELLDQDGQLKILNIKVVPLEGKENTEKLRATHLAILQPIEDQLKLIDKNELKEAYDNYTSREFKSKASFEVFKKFLEKYPIIATFTEFDILNINANDDTANVQFSFRKDKSKFVVDYGMVKEGGRWLVNGVQIEPVTEAQEDAADFDASVLIKPMQAQLDAIKAGDVKRAYENYTSKAFREATDFNQFKKFLEGHSVFTHNSGADFYKLSFNNNIGIYNARLKSTDGDVREVEYSLIKEDGVWKIMQIQIYEKGSDPET